MSTGEKQPSIGAINREPQDNPWFDHQTRCDALAHAVTLGAKVGLSGDAVVANAESFRKFLAGDASE